MEILVFKTGPVKANTYFLVYAPGKAAVIDPGGNERWLLSELDTCGLTVTHILLTHGHFDHIGAAGAIYNKFNCHICVHEQDAHMLPDPVANLSASFGARVTAPEADTLLVHGSVIHLGSKNVTVIHTPGHTKGGVCFLADNLLFTGDTLFHNSIGRTDFPGGDYDELLASIKNNLFTLPGDYVVHPGHEEETTLSYERQENPFLGFGWNG